MGDLAMNLPRKNFSPVLLSFFILTGILYLILDESRHNFKRVG